ncbi:MAG: hypothetical protein PHW53_02645 [Patescibacteria group bacterium]|nr:hypothetical protein [Patescibacteria group bacterium]
MSEKKMMSPRQLRELMAVVSRHLSIHLPAKVAQSVIDKPGDLEFELCELFWRIAEANEKARRAVEAKHIIDCDADPYLLGLFTVEEHRRSGQLEWDPDKVVLYLSDLQRGRSVVQGHALRKELQNQSVLNACVLDYLLVHPNLIPIMWMRMRVYFWGTIYCDREGDLCVRGLFWEDEKGWFWRYKHLSHDFYRDDTAAVSASV